MKYYYHIPLFEVGKRFKRPECAAVWTFYVNSFCTVKEAHKEFEDTMRKFAFRKQILSNAHVTLCLSRHHLGGTMDVRTSSHLAVMEVYIFSIPLYAIHFACPNSRWDE